MAINGWKLMDMAGKSCYWLDMAWNDLTWLEKAVTMTMTMIINLTFLFFFFLIFVNSVPKLIRLLLNTNNTWKIQERLFYIPKGRENSSEGHSPSQELEVDSITGRNFYFSIKIMVSHSAHRPSIQHLLASQPGLIRPQPASQPASQG